MPFELPQELADSIPADHLSHASIQKYDSFPDFVKGHLELDSYRGRSIALPNGESKPEELDAWRTEQSAKLKDRGLTISRLGDLPPADPNGYDIKLQELGAEVLAKDEVFAASKAMMHKHGLNNAQAQGLVQDFIKEIFPKMTESMPPVKEEISGDKVFEVLDKEFPGQTESTLDGYQKGVEFLSVKHPALKDFLNTQTLEYDGKLLAAGDHPMIIKLVNELAAVTGMDFGGNMGGATTPANQEGQALLDEAKDIMQNPSNPKYELYRNNDAGVHKYISDLYAKVYPGNVNI